MTVHDSDSTDQTPGMTEAPSMLLATLLGLMAGVALSAFLLGIMTALCYKLFMLGWGIIS